MAFQLLLGAQLDAEIGQLEAEFKAAGESIEAFKGGAFGNQQGFAEYLRAFSSIQFPVGVNLDARGRVYVADSGNDRVQMWSY